MMEHQAKNKALCSSLVDNEARMTAYITYKEGKVYNLAHLRPFDLALAKVGHPLCDMDGNEISHMFERKDNMVRVIFWQPRVGIWRSKLTFIEDDDHLRLAPLAIKEGRPLHVGDKYVPDSAYWGIVLPPIESRRDWSWYSDNMDKWCWPVEMKAEVAA